MDYPNVSTYLDDGEMSCAHCLGHGPSIFVENLHEGVGSRICGECLAVALAFFREETAKRRGPTEPQG